MFSAYMHQTEKAPPTDDAFGKRVYGMYKGVRVGIIRTNGKIATVFPDSNQPKKNGGQKNEH